MMNATVHSNAGAFDTGYFDKEIEQSYENSDGSKNTSYFGKEGSSYWSGLMAKELGLDGKPVDNKVALELAKGFVNGKAIGKILSTEQVEKIQKDEKHQIASGKMQPHQKLGIYPIPDEDGKFLAHRAGTELTFSAPKSVSIIALVMKNQQVLDAHTKATDMATADLEKMFSRTRIGKGGAEYKYDQGTIFANYRHNVSRSADPHLHTHSFMFNLAMDGDKQIRTQSNEELLKYQRSIGGTIYRSHLANELKKLGYEIEARPQGMWEIKGMPQKAIDGFSKRSHEIDQMAKEIKENNNMISEPEARELALASRNDKVIESLEKNTERWIPELKSYTILDIILNLQDKDKAYQANIQTIITEKFDPDQIKEVAKIVSKDVSTPNKAYSQSADNKQELDIIKAELKNNIDQFCGKYFPNGRRDGKHWVTGDIYDKKEANSSNQSFKIDVIGGYKGQGSDFSKDGGSKQYNPFNMLVERYGGITEAILEAKTFLGLSNTPQKSIIKKEIQTTTVDTKEAEKQQLLKEERTARNVQKIWKETQAIKGTYAEKYLNARGIKLDNIDTKNIRFHPSLAICFHPSLAIYKDDKNYYRSALVVGTTDNDGKLQAISRIYLDKDSNVTGKSHAKMMLGPVSGSGVRFKGKEETPKQIIIGEGVETMLSVKQHYPDAEVVATLSTSHMKNFIIPDGVQQVIIAADNDKSEAGLKAAQSVGEKAKNNNVNVLIYMPKNNDFNDDLKDTDKEILKDKLHSKYLGRDKSIQKHLDSNKIMKVVVQETIDKYAERQTVFDVRRMVGDALSTLTSRDKSLTEYQTVFKSFTNHPDLRFGIDKDGRVVQAQSKENFEREHNILRLEKTIRPSGVLIATQKNIDAVEKQSFKKTGHMFSKGQKDALEVITNSPNRVVCINGNPGAGKTFMLGRLEEISQKNGFTVEGLSNSCKARDELKKAGIGGANTISHFLNHYKGYLKDARHKAEVYTREEKEILNRNEKLPLNNINHYKLNNLRNQFSKKVLVVDESSMIGNKKMEDILLLSQYFNIPKIAFVGDTNQLLAIEAGKPFELLIKSGALTAEQPENFRSKSQQQKDVVHSNTYNSVVNTIEILTQNNLLKETLSKDAAHIFAQEYAKVKNKGIDVIGIATKIEHRDQLNQMTRNFLTKIGTQKADYIVHRQVRMEIVDKMYANNYTPKHIIEFDGNCSGVNKDGEKQYISKGDKYTIETVDDDTKTLRLQPLGSKNKDDAIDFAPGNIKKDSILWDSYTTQKMEIATGEELRMTKGYNKEGIVNNGQYEVMNVDEKTKALTLMNKADGEIIEINKDNLALKHMDYGYVATAHSAQGLTCEKTVAYLDPNDKELVNNRSFTVAITRATHDTSIVTLDTEKLTKTLEIKREERTAIEAHKDGINLNLADNQAKADHKQVDSPTGQGQKIDINYYTDTMPTTMDIPTSAYEEDMNIERRMDINDYGISPDYDSFDVGDNEQSQDTSKDKDNIDMEI